MKYTFMPLLLLTAVSAFGQLVPVITTVNRPYGPVNTLQYVSPTYYGMGNRSRVVPKSQKHEYVIVMKNDSVIRAKARLEPAHIFFMEIKNAKSEKFIKPADTKEIYRLSRKGKKQVGIPADSCWWFTCIEGRLKGYSKYSSKKSRYAQMFSVGDGKMMLLTRKNLEAVLPPDVDPQVRWLVQQGFLVRAIKAFNKNAR